MSFPYQIPFILGKSVPSINVPSGGFPYQLPITFGTSQEESPTVKAGQFKFRYVVEEAITGRILCNDLRVVKPNPMRTLSGGAHIEFDVDYRDLSAQNIAFSPWGFWVHATCEINGNNIVWASCIVKPGQVDKTTGVLHLVADGFSQYPRGIPWLQNYNPLTVDPFQVVITIWNYVQSFNTGNLGVSVYPSSSGLQMLPGYTFDGSINNVNFFAEYNRPNQLTDCADVIDSLARDIPFDYIEKSAWNTDMTAIIKSIEMGYPNGGQQQDGLVFAINENVVEALPFTENNIDWASDIIVSGWLPTQEVQIGFTNGPPNRYRRVLTQNDIQINSIERAQAWAQRKLTKRQTPPYWSDIAVQLHHPNAPFGSYDVGDRIFVTGYMPWHGNVNQLHKILSIQVDEEKGLALLQLYAEEAYLYNPIFWQGSQVGSTTIQETALTAATAAIQTATVEVM